MNAKTKMTLMAVIGLAVLFFAIPAAAVDDTPAEMWNGPAVDISGDQQTDWWPCFNPAGTWYGSNEMGFTYLVSITPLDRWRHRFSIVSDGVNDNTMGGFFPTMEDAVNFRGELVRTGRNTYDCTQVTYGVDADHQMVVFVVVSGTFTMVEDDMFIWEMYIALYDPMQDPFGEDPPLYGCMGPVNATYSRVPMLPPCEP